MQNQPDPRHLLRCTFPAAEIPHQQIRARRKAFGASRTTITSSDGRAKVLANHHSCAIAMAAQQLQDAFHDAAAASDTDMEMDIDMDMDVDPPAALASPSSSTGSHPSSFCEPSCEGSTPPDAMREAIRGMESELVDLVFDCSGTAGESGGGLADWLKVPLERATASGNLAVVKRLLDAGVGTDPPSNGMRLGLLLHTAAGSGNAGVVEAILECGADVRGVDKDLHNWTALHVAAASGHDAAVRAIASAPLADVNVADTRGWTPLHVAANAGHRGVVVFLLLMGATALLLSVPEGDSPLHLAAANNHAGVIEDLLTLGNAYAGLCNHAGRTGALCCVLVLSCLLDHQLLTPGEPSIFPLRDVLHTQPSSPSIHGKDGLVYSGRWLAAGRYDASG